MVSWGSNGAPTVMRSPRFRWFFVSRTLTLFANTMLPLLLAFAVLDITSSATALGVVLASRSIPLVAFMLVGGVVSDRFSRSTVLVVGNLMSGVTQAAAAALLITGTAELWSLAALEAVNGVVVAFMFPAMTSVVPMVVERDQIQSANALFGFARNGSSILGPALGGLFYVTLGAGWGLAANAAMFFVATYCMSRLRLPVVARDAGSSVRQDLREGWIAFTARTWVWTVVGSWAVLNMVQAGVVATLGPVIAKDTVGAGAWGFVLSAEGLGFVLMTLVLMRVRLRFPLRAGLLGMSVILLPMLVLGIAPAVIPLVVTFFIAGAAAEILAIGWQTALHEHVPNDVLSRVSSYELLGSFVAIPIGQLLVGPLSAMWGERELAVAGGVLCVLAAGLPLLSRSVRNLQSAVAVPD